MFLSDPGRTAYDLNFNFLGFPVRVHPLFFVLPIFLGRGLISPNVNTGVGVLIVVAIFFVSILVHELGHALAFRYYGIPSRIVLFWLGGFATPTGAGFGGRRTELSSNQRIVVSLAGPVFGFLLAALLVGLVYVMGGTIVRASIFGLPLPFPDFADTAFNVDTVRMVFVGGILLNIILNVFNLIPIFPLDGGQVARQVMTQMDARNGLRNSIILSIVASILIALFALQINDMFLAIFFGFMAYSNYQSLAQYGRPRW